MKSIKTSMKKKEIEFPDCWEEVLPAEWLYLLRLRKKLEEQKGVSLADVKREWCRFVLANRGIRAASKNEYYVLIYNLAMTLGWMWRESEDGLIVELTFDSTKNLMPAWKNLRGPLSHGSDLTFGEFRQATMMMNAYNETKEPLMLQMLCGILYRKPGKKVGKTDFDGRYREEFNQARINLYAERVRTMPTQMQWGIYAWFATFCEYLMTGTFITEGSQVSFAQVFGRGEAGDDGPKEESLGMNSVLFSVAEAGVFGNVEQTDGTLLLRVMMKLLDDKLRVDAMTRRNK